MLRLAISLISLLAVTAAAACSSDGVPPPPEPATAQPPASGQTLTLGDVSDSPAETIEAFQPLADHLAAELAGDGVGEGKVLVAPDLETMMEYLASGKVDLYFDSPYPALTVYEEVGAHPLLRRWKKGVGEYHTKIVVGADSGITDIDGLVGKVMAFDDEVSTSGYLLPKAHLLEMGYQMTEQASATGSPAAGAIGYVFAGGEENVLAWVLAGKTAGAAIPSGDFEDLDRTVQSRLLVLDETPDVPRHIALAGPDLDEGLRGRIVEVLLAMDGTPEGRAALEAFESTSKFDQLPQGPEGAMTALQELFGPVR